jgi:hypothetical protein
MVYNKVFIPISFRIQGLGGHEGLRVIFMYIMCVISCTLGFRVLDVIFAVFIFSLQFDTRSTIGSTSGR